MSEYLRISDFANLIGVSTSTVRQYEKDGLLVPHHKTLSGQRLYTYEQVNTFIKGEFSSSILRGVSCDEKLAYSE